ncbi:MAG: hypothetical protein KatS3mg080_0397 [Anoxybacillus sp.]|nr:MAG: hypothetical protein KatS3mg080_0397 [Anoxybacillus sp.]
MKQNIGVINAMIRITCGFTMLAWATANFSRKPWRESYIWVIMLAAMKNCGRYRSFLSCYGVI